MIVEEWMLDDLADNECRHMNLPIDPHLDCDCFAGIGVPAKVRRTPDLMTTLKTKPKRKPKAAPKPSVLTNVIGDLDREIIRLTTARDELRKLAA